NTDTKQLILLFHAGHHGLGIKRSQGRKRRPSEGNALIAEQGLEILEQRLRVSDGARRDLALQAECSEQARGLAHIPFHMMHAIGAVRDVRNAQALAARKQILHPDRYQRAERDLKWPTPEIQIALAADARVEIDPVAADADGIFEKLGSVWPQRIGDVLLEHRELGFDAARLADVRRLREPVDGAPDHVSTKAEPSIPHAAVRPRAFRLKPIHQAEATLPGRFSVEHLLDLVDVADRAEPVIVLRPIDDADLMGPKAFLEVRNIENSAEIPPRLAVFRLEQVPSDRFVGFRLLRRPPQEGSRPARRLIAAPQLVLARLVYRVILPWDVLHREAHGNGLLVPRVGHLRSMRLAGLCAGLGATHVLHAGKLEQLSLRCGIDEIRG